MDFRQASAYLDSLTFQGMKLGLEGASRLLNRLDNPHEKLKVIHVAGTNGKGSTCSMISSILTSAGISNGLYTSPHIESFTERIQINGAPIDERASAELITSVKSAAEAHEPLSPTYFEFMTAMAIKQFVDEGAEYAVLEVGLGGRFDATNIVDPEVSVITTIALDHMKHLGDSLSDIAFEKCGVIKNGAPLVCGVRDRSVSNDIIAQADSVSAPVTLIDRDFHTQRIEQDGWGERFNYRNGGRLDNIDIPIPGVQQIDNASIAIAVAMILNGNGLDINESAIREGLANVKTPGRFEKVSDGPTIILDGAHNPHAAAALCATLLEKFGRKNVDFIFGPMGDKDYTSMFENLAPSARSFTCFSPDVERAIDPAQLAAAQADRSIPTTIANSVGDVIKLFNSADSGKVFCVTGSFYTLGELRPAIRQALG